jgi:phospholipid-translocating ATPase
MARIQFDGAEGESHVSKPVKRMRWASQHVTGQNAVRKRMSVIKRFHRRPASAEEKQCQDEAMSISAGPEASAQSQPRTVYVNLPVPEDARDENGHVKQHFVRNKIRTSKYTPLSFVPKNLWFQFHNIANVYFLFIIILGVCRISLQIHESYLSYHRFSPFLELQIQA